MTAPGITAAGPAAARPPLDVDVCVTSSCNLACDYCYTRRMRRISGAGRLDAAGIKRAVDILAGDRNFQARHSGRANLVFLGGEPLIEFAALREAVKYVRSRPAPFSLSVTTNGTLLTAEKMDFFAANDVAVYVSLDGRKSTNDRHRRFKNRKAGSVFDAVTETLESLFADARFRKHLRISPTFTGDTVRRMADSVDFISGKFGVRAETGIDIYGDWGRAGRAGLREALRKIRLKFLACLKRASGEAGDDFFDVVCPEDDMIGVPSVWERSAGYNELATGAVTLFSDGRFYPCDLAFLPALDKKHCVGDIKTGLDFDKLDALCSEPELLDLSRNCRRYILMLPPLMRYRWGRFSGFSVAELDRLTDDTAAVNGIFDEELGQYIKLQVMRRRLLAEPGFGDFTRGAGNGPARRDSTLKLC